MSDGVLFEHVAVIDDSGVDRRLALRVLLRSPLVGEAMEFANGAEALDWFAAAPGRRLDLVFLDIRMPRMDGFQFLDALRLETMRPAPVDVVAMLTTSLDPRDRARAEAYGEIKAYIDKPLVERHLEELAAQRRAA
jgi:CheY-like chemotaxis protein